MQNPIRIVIVGGGVASFVAGIKLRDQLPQADLTILSASNEKMLGGHLASWDENGYPIEHGLHALFGFYENILPLLKRVGAYKNFSRSARHTFVYEKGRLHKFHLSTWLATYGGFTKREKLQLASFLPKLLELAARVEVSGVGSLFAYDAYDMREFGRKYGIPETVLQSNFFRQFYDAAFNEPHELSATVGIQSLYQMFRKPWHYYFNHPSKESLIDPLRRYFVEECGGKVELNRKLIGLQTDNQGMKVTHLEVRDLVTNRTEPLTADEYVVAVGVEEFKLIKISPLPETNDYFRNIHRLQTVSSLSLQAWFKHDPVPTGLDSLIGGLPEPFSIVCPVSRVRQVRSPEERRFPHELVATGPEAGFEEVDDESLKKSFLATLKGCGFLIPDHPEEMHVVIRRNREPLHRYLLTRPGEIMLRPPCQSPYTNLCLAGAWIRNSFTLPCVDAAAESGITVAKLIGQRVKANRLTGEANRFMGMPPQAPLVLAPPYRFPNSEGVVFLCETNPKALLRELPVKLKPLPLFRNKLLVAALRHQDVQAEQDPSGCRYSYEEIVIAALIREKKGRGWKGYGIYPLYVYVNDDTAMAAGREVYGFPKKMAQISLNAEDFTVVRKGRPPEAGPGSVTPLTLLQASWAGKSTSEKAMEKGLEGWLRKMAPQLGLGLLGQHLPRILSVPFYNFRDLPGVNSSAFRQSALQELTRVAASDLQIKSMGLCSSPQLTISPSLQDPLHRLFPSSPSGINILKGFSLKFSFSLGESE